LSSATSKSRSFEEKDCVAEGGDTLLPDTWVKEEAGDPLLVEKLMLGDTVDTKTEDRVLLLVERLVA
jgi:hypothetical protein